MNETPLSSDKNSLDKDLEKLGFFESATNFVLVRAAAPGLAFIVLVAAAIFSALFVSGGSSAMVIVLASAVAAYMAMNIGANDVTNNVGAAVGSRALSMGGALAIAAVFEIAGAMISGGKVIHTISSGIIAPDLATSPGQIILLMISALLSAAIWINLATWLNAPVSTTHSIIGGIMGAGVAAIGQAAIRWTVLSQIALSWIVSPIFGAIFAIAFMWLISETLIYRDDKIAAARKWLPFMLATMSGSFFAYLLVTIAVRFPSFGILRAVILGAIFGALAFFVFRAVIFRQSIQLENRTQSLKSLFRMPLVFSAALLSFAHGSNDVANAIGPLAAIVAASGKATSAAYIGAPFWVTTIGAIGISAGLLLFGPRLIRIVGTEITRLNPLRAYCVAMSAALTVILASALGMPVSTTHIAVGSVFGVGLFREWYAIHSTRRRDYIERRAALAGNPLPMPIAEVPVRHFDIHESEDRRYRYLVRRSYLLSILAAWTITVPTSGLLAASFVLLVNHFIH
jgi:PiT family inorganic phosphate transporter